MSRTNLTRVGPSTHERRSERRRGGLSSRFIVLTGLSGAGKSQAIRALEDLGYFCVDNLPITLIPTLAQLTLRAGTDIAKAAVVVDIREGTLLAQFPKIYNELRRTPGLHPRLIFLEASDAALQRRFSETRRPHPLAPDRSAAEGIREERNHLKPIRRMADQILDTTAMTVHDLRRAFLHLSREGSAQAPLVVTILSFGFKHGIPVDADLLFDVRFLPNPHFVPSLRPYSGKDRPVMKFLEQSEAMREFLDRTTNLLEFLLPQYISEGKAYLTIGIGCTGGRHRSVAIAEALRKRLGVLQGLRIRVRHRDINNE
ncbi:MAG TPA: RNase adapter RapZ [Vicinamibacterales bacterium]|nr:RNase adapter RapZ [Vicinamibacterales bacterium]